MEPPCNDALILFNNEKDKLLNAVRATIKARHEQQR